MENSFDPQQVPTTAQPQQLPPFPQLIMEAIEAAEDPNGCNKTAIAKHIESTQLTLPPSHTTLLNFHLDQMKKSGQIVMVKDNFVKPDPDAPKRGRGRPPKLKPQVDPSDVPVPAPSRPRGRPPKSKEPSVSGRPRGRPPKKAKTDTDTVKAEEPSAEPNVERRGRGRPPKAKPVLVPAGC